MLSTLIFIPIFGSFLLLIIPKTNTLQIKITGFIISIITFLYSLFLWIYFDNSTSQFQWVENFIWNPYSNMYFYLGIDGISLFFIILTTFLIPLCLLASWDSIQKSIKEYFISFLIIEAMLLVVFSVLDLVLFYIFFESILIPMFLVIGIWGSRERKIKAAYQFFIYTLIGSVLMLLAILLIYFETGTTDFQTLLNYPFGEKRQLLLWLAFFSSFAVKVPMIPFHIWLPEAHVEAPTAGSVLLAGILLKLGTYGFLRFSISLFPEASLYFTPLIYTISIISIIYGSLTTLRQTDLKRIIAYSSVAHMGFVTIGLFTFNMQGIEGSIILMLSHGLVSGALFLCIGVLYDRYHTRLLKYYGGLTQAMPLFACIFLFFTLANISLPGTSSFTGEFLILMGAFQSNTSVTFLASLGVILGAAYSIWLYNRVMFGQLKLTYIKEYSDINKREFAIFMPLIITTLWMGIYPKTFLEPMHMSIGNLLEIVNKY
jgi:proton-translocating NADH-quinone oxidoreductase chain M